MFILKNIANEKWNFEKGLSNFIGRVIQLPSMLNVPISVVKCFQHSLPKLVSTFVNCPNYILNSHQVQSSNDFIRIILQRLHGKVRTFTLSPKHVVGGRVVRWCRVNFQCWGVLLIWIIVGQGPTALVVGAGGVGWNFFSHLSLLFSLSLSLRDGPT